MGMSIAGGVGSLTSNVVITGPFGQQTMANSIPVVIASNQSPVSENVAQWGGVNTSLGQAAMAASVPVVLANNQSAVPVNTTLLAGIAITLGLGTVDTGTQRITLATDQPAIATKAPVNTNGATVNTALTATTASSASPPANAVGFILQAEKANTDPIRYALGATASTTAGILLEPEQDTGYIAAATAISVCATVSGTNAFSIIWVLSA